jgi:hypothetical protein
LLNTIGAAPGQYNVTLEVDINASATQSIELVAGGTVVNATAGSARRNVLRQRHLPAPH